MPKRYLKNFYIKDYILITFGLILYAIGLIAFIVPGKMVTGGGVGIALLIEYATGIPLQYTNFALNVILLIFALKILGPKFMVKTIYGVVMLTILLSVARMIFKEGLIEDEPLFAGVIGGVLCGAGIGLVFTCNGSTGGMDIVIAIINKYKSIAFGRAMLFFDCLIISGSYFIFHNYKIIVASLIVLGVMTYVIDLVINGSKQSVQVLIFSTKYEKIATAINYELKRGCTVLDGVGWYSKNQVKVIIVLTKRTEANNLLRLVKTIDEQAFISQSTVRGVYGNGFETFR